MKKLETTKFLLVVFLLSGWVGANAQTTLESEVPGDNFSLEGALELFKKSASPEEFEKRLNSADSRVNNLDLNSDGNIDYVRVIDRNEGNVHAFIIQAVLSETDRQDVAVIELEKLANGKAVLQITGDSDIYGVETIIEPTEEVRVNAGTTTARTVVNVWTWPSVQYVYSPYYSVWDSPWGWAYHPFWWRPWRPVAFYVYDPWWRPYRSYYSLCYSHRIGYLPRLYSPYRATSVIVYNNHHHQIDRYRSHNHGRDRYDGRSADGRHRYEGYAGRSRADHHGRSRTDYNNWENNDSGRRYEANANSSRNRSVETSRDNNRRDELNTGRSRNLEQSSSHFRRSPDRTLRSSGSGLQRKEPEQRSLNRPSQHRETNGTFNESIRQQRETSPLINKGNRHLNSASDQGIREHRQTNNTFNRDNRQLRETNSGINQNNRQLREPNTTFNQGIREHRQTTNTFKQDNRQLRQPSTTFNSGNYQQRSSGSPSVERSHGRQSIPSGGGKSGNGSSGSRSNQRGRH